jgi:hypothetical protein
LGLQAVAIQWPEERIWKMAECGFLVISKRHLERMKSTKSWPQQRTVARGKENFQIPVGTNWWMTRCLLSCRLTLPTHAMNNRNQVLAQLGHVKASQRVNCGCQQAMASPFWPGTWRAIYAVAATGVSSWGCTGNATLGQCFRPLPTGPCAGPLLESFNSCFARGKYRCML